LTVFLTYDLTPLNDPNFSIDSTHKYLSKVDQIAGFVYISLILSIVYNVQSEQLMFIPIGSLLLPLIYFILVRHISKNNFVTLIFPLYIVFDSGLMLGFYNIFKYTFTYYLLFLCLILYISIRKNTKQQNMKYHVGILVLFIGMTFIHYTLSFVTIIILFVDYILSLLEKNL